MVSVASTVNGWYWKKKKKRLRSRRSNSEWPPVAADNRDLSDFIYRELSYFGRLDIEWVSMNWACWAHWWMRNNWPGMQRMCHSSVLQFYLAKVWEWQSGDWRLATISLSFTWLRSARRRGNEREINEEHAIIIAMNVQRTIYFNTLLIDALDYFKRMMCVCAVCERRFSRSCERKIM